MEAGGGWRAVLGRVGELGWTRLDMRCPFEQHGGFGIEREGEREGGKQGECSMIGAIDYPDGEIMKIAE